MEDKNIKILIAFHKPYTTVKSELFAPIHVGREIAFEKNKDGIINKEDYNWLIENTIGDNTGDNISSLNRNFCELTAIYWAWKNYDKLGNPEYVGLMHYRTFFDFCKFAKINKLKDIENNFFYNKEFFNYILSSYDGVIAKSIDLVNISKFAKIEDYKNVIENTYKDYLYIVNDKYPQLVPAINYFKQNRGVHFKNMFILKKEDFMEYCELLFNILNDIQKEKNYDDKSRMLGYIAEKISSIIFDYLTISKNKKFLNAEFLPILDYQQENKKTLIKKLKQVQIKKHLLFFKKYHYQKKETMYKHILSQINMFKTV